MEEVWLLRDQRQSKYLEDSVTEASCLLECWLLRVSDSIMMKVFKRILVWTFNTTFFTAIFIVTAAVFFLISKTLLQLHLLLALPTISPRIQLCQWFIKSKCVTSLRNKSISVNTNLGTLTFLLIQMDSLILFSSYCSVLTTFVPLLSFLLAFPSIGFNTPSLRFRQRQILRQTEKK
jgi:hypothetical protein